MAVSPPREKMLLSLGYTKLGQYVVATSHVPKGLTVSVFTYIPRPPRIIAGGVVGLAAHATPDTHDCQTINPANLYLNV